MPRDIPGPPESITDAIDKSNFPPTPPRPDELITEGLAPEPDELGGLNDPSEMFSDIGDGPPDPLNILDLFQD